MDYIYVRSKMNVGLFNITQGITKKARKSNGKLKKNNVLGKNWYR